VVFLQDPEAAVAFLSGQLLPGDLVLTLGAGDVWRVGERLLAVLAKPAAAKRPSKKAGDRKPL
jgi:UDP-N-acetylmuramate-alanine ligase